MLKRIMVAWFAYKRWRFGIHVKDVLASFLLVWLCARLLTCMCVWMYVDMDMDAGVDVDLDVAMVMGVDQDSTWVALRMRMCSWIWT